MMKIKLTEINSSLPTGEAVLILGLGFDKRCLSILEFLSLDSIVSVLGVHNGGWIAQSDKNVTEFIKLSGVKGYVVGKQSISAIQVVDELFSALKPLMDGNKDLNYLIDATGFSHELLCIVIGLLNNQSLTDKVHILYTGAAQYSTNTDFSQKWLSRGVIDVRSILGFPGEMLPSRKLHLIIMAGFEVERAAEVIARYEPASLSIGIGSKEQSISMDHYEINMRSHVEIIDVVQSMHGISCDIYKFEFSCINPTLAKSQILEHALIYSDYNVVVCPLNTKLSTIGAALAAIENPKIQLCYSQPREYNIDGYASAGDLATVVKLA